jgi:cytochrome c
MSSRNRGCAVQALIVAIVALPVRVGAQEGFAETATQADIDEVYLSIATDGENLPAGSGTPDVGKPLYETHCAACHGLEGEGTLAQRLVGGIGSLATDSPVKTVGSYWPTATTVFDYLRRAMPYTAPMSLTDSDYYAITSYLLFLNGLIDAETVVSNDSLPAIEMPNRDGFVSAYPRVPPEYDYVAR